MKILNFWEIFGILKFFEIFEILKICRFKKKLKILKFLKNFEILWNIVKFVKFSEIFEIFWNFRKFWNFNLFWDNVETPRSTHSDSEVQPRKYCLGQSANSKIPYHLTNGFYISWIFIRIYSLSIGYALSCDFILFSTVWPLNLPKKSLFITWSYIDIGQYNPNRSIYNILTE